MRIINKIGAPVTGDDFYGREKEIAQAHRYLNEGQSLLLSAPRRIGKSSLAKRLLADMQTHGWKCVYIDLQGIATQEAFLRLLINAFKGAGLMKKTGHLAKNFLSTVFNYTESIELGAFKVDLNHKGNLESLYNRLAATFDYEEDTLIVVDELPLFLGKLMNENVDARGEVEFLLNWFRSLRQNEHSKLRWIFCGSVGLRNFTNHYQMSQSINDLIDFELGAFPQHEAIGFLKLLATSYNFRMDDEVTLYALTQLQWPIPYFIQLIVDKIISSRPLEDVTPVTIQDVDRAIDTLSQSDYFMTWDERLSEYRDLEPFARQVLDRLSVLEDGQVKGRLVDIAMAGRKSFEEAEVRKQLTKVLEMLEHDGYLLRNGSVRKFRSPLLRRWWNHKFID